MDGIQQFSLAGKVVVITGATGVLGESFALATAAAGAKVAVLGRNEERAHARVEAIKSNGGTAMAVITDVLDEAAVQRAKEQILAAWGTIDGLVNAAGGNIPGATIGPDQNLFEAKIEDTKKAVELNLFGTVIPTHVFGRVIAEKGKGSIVNISSLAAQQAITRVLGYNMAKCAIEGYTKWMAVELAQRYGDKIRVNAIAPGVFLTEQNRTLLTNPDGSYTDRAQRFVNNTAYGRLGAPQELTGTLIFLLSDASGFVSGETILVDGGFNAWSGV
ncbi:NAD(P)-dependent dehydrogenase, short-chain alcohol dehydrogenase family [Parapedobacter composti]|uniref:NAD(P)-dependent dehydrogenase, short-chain alcohol dehydrogenase family n=1 Tax=Parapedobacter composti TaxID=623281 RepID=A0A1I1IWQ3_9SPHI|nr:SDR family oxidoreductase [Parapedobacter composti]SFC40727.1 NAD(P)-dependent dehydrogenase, short-chain alcohol dehydrogenase family [Parapedobacter composti]